MQQIFFNSWQAIGRVALIGTLAYLAIIVILRVSGKRALSKMNAFDWIVTVALGSTLASILLSKDLALAEGLAAFATLLGLQYLITWLSVRSRFVSELIKSEPTLLVHKGKLLRGALRRERVVESEVFAALRAEGLSSLEQAEAVVLETDGSFSVIPRSVPSDGEALAVLQAPEDPSP